MKIIRANRYLHKFILASVKALAVLTAVTLLTACTTVGYYSQIVSGHMKIVMGKRPVAEVVSDENVNEALKRRLDVAQRARHFGINTLGLPNNESYTSFYDTGKRYVTWNVIAAGEFSFDPYTWCFPIAGCVSYRGYYAEEDAKSYATEIAEREGLDVTVTGATAYSTLGWFKDPLLNTMLTRSDPAIASLIFHELAHQKLYVGDDSTFNESFATFVENQGLKQWEQHESLNNPQPNDEQMSAELEARKMRQQQFVALLRTTREDLEELYGSSISEDEMRVSKQQRFQQMRSEYQELKQSWNNYEGYDHWFSQDLNNARLVSVATYNDYIPAFKEMFDQSGGSLAEFYEAAEKVAELPAEERTSVMENLLSQSSVVSQ